MCVCSFYLDPVQDIVLSYALFRYKRVMQWCAVGQLLIYICSEQHFIFNGPCGATNHSYPHIRHYTQVNKVINLCTYNEISKISFMFFSGTSRRARTSWTARKPRCPGQWAVNRLSDIRFFSHPSNKMFWAFWILSTGTSRAPRSHWTSRREGKISHAYWTTIMWNMPF